MTELTRAAMRADLANEVFAPPAGCSHERRVGVETELIPVDAATGRRCPIEDESVPSMLPFLRRFGACHGWVETKTSKGTPSFQLGSGGTLTFEPGGQIEYSSPPCHTPSELLGLLRSVIPPLRSAAADEGICLLASGIDPANSIEQAPLLLAGKRYGRMAEYLARRGPWGARMMRQTASLQVSVDFGDEPWMRWRVLNAAAPYVVAIFANSPLYEGRSTGWRSTRSRAWRELDPMRTGLPYDPQAPLDEYLEFALNAPAMLMPAVNGVNRSFREWLERAAPTFEEWRDHLSTLFPEVRPRGHMELRSADSVAPQWYAAPLALVAGIVYDAEALRTAVDLLGQPDLGLLQRAGRLGLTDPALGDTAIDLVNIALAGCERLGPAYFHPADLDEARAFFDCYTRRGRSPADDVESHRLSAISYRQVRSRRAVVAERLEALGSDSR